MDPDRWSQLESLFHAAVARAPQERAGFLAEACAGDEELREQVAKLLAHDRTDASFIEAPAVQIAARRLAREGGQAELPTLAAGDRDSADTPGRGGGAGDGLEPGRLLGSFRIVRQIGEGGMGEVYLVEDLKLGRHVALKLLPSALAPDARARQRFFREAKAASALNHPHIVTIYNIEEAKGLTFIVMEYIEGESLRERLAHGPAPLADVTAWGVQIAEAIGAAHAINIVHRDLKPGNILIAASGQAKIVDFGLAKGVRTSGAPSREELRTHPAAAEGLSASFSLAGEIAGTVPYMSPEQTRGEHLDGRSDVFSLGCVLYEAATGQRPFLGPTIPEVIQEIRTRDPRPPSALVPGLPKEFDRIVLRALAKEKAKRFATAMELAAALRRMSRSQARRRLVKRLQLPVLLAAVLLAALVGIRHWRESNRRWASERAAHIPELAKAGRFFEAYDLARAVEKYLPDDPTLKEWRPLVTDVLSVTTEPPGAQVFLRRFWRDASGEFPPRELIGTTPIIQREIARGEYLLAVEKEGYTPILRTLSNELDRMEKGLWVPGTIRKTQLTRTPDGKYDMFVDSYAPIEIHLRLIDVRRAPPRMVWVPGGEYALVGQGRPSNESVRLDDYFIDQCEVSNREYREFLAAGGYETRRYWKHPFVKDGKTLSWEEGLALLTDRTGQPGPRSWRQQRFPQGQDNHPVTDVTWYEAAAYAAFRGKSLPTLYQWEKAARDGRSTVFWGGVLPWGLVGLNPQLEDRANFYGQGTVPVESYEFGISPYGCYHMAGNALEWCLNARPDGFTTAGSSYHEGPNLFGAYGQFPGFYSSPRLGFRCVLNSPQATGDQGGMPLQDEHEIPQYSPVDEDAYRLMRAHYEYDRLPLHANVEEEVETELWQRLKISYVGYAGAADRRAEGPPPEKRALAYLWLPKHAPRPLQVVNYKPGGASYAGLTVPQEAEVVCAPFLLSGRAVFVALIEGMRERDLPPDWEMPGEGTVAYREMMVRDTVDQRRGLDYLATRDDIDMHKIACMGLSMGGYDLITMAVEDRFAGTILLAAGLGIGPKNANRIAEADPVNFAPYIRGPKLMIQGRFDESIPFKTAAWPLFQLLSEPKELVVLETGHFPPLDQWAPPALRWLDAVLGPVAVQNPAAASEPLRVLNH